MNSAPLKYFVDVKRGDLHLPPVRDVEQCIAQREGLSRPELATLSARVKMQLYEELLEEGLATEGGRTDFPADPNGSDERPRMGLIERLQLRLRLQELYNELINND